MYQCNQRRIKPIAILSFLFLLSVSTYGQKMRDLSNEKFDTRNGLLYFKSKPFSGVGIVYQDQTHPKSKVEYKRGLVNGIAEYYLKNHKIKEKGILLQKNAQSQLIKEGYWEFYDTKGSIIGKCFYKNGIPDNGVHVTYYESEIVKSITTYMNGLKNGESKLWFKNGNLQAIGSLFQENVDDTLHKKTGIWNYYDINGDFLGKGNYAQGLLSNGIGIQYFENEAIKSMTEVSKTKGNEYTYDRRDTKKTKEVNYFKNGHISSIIEDYSNYNGTYILLHENYFENGLIRDKYVVDDNQSKIKREIFEYHLNGEVQEKITYNLQSSTYDNSSDSCSDNHTEATYESFFQNGEIYLSGNLKLCKRTGVWSEYNQDGELKSKYYYNNDSLNNIARFKNGNLLEKDYDGYILRLSFENHDKYQGKGFVDKPLRLDGALFSGKVIVLYNNGGLFTKQEYIDGLKHGLWEKYYTNGNIQHQLNYKAGVLDGISTFFLENKTLWFKQEFKGGVKIRFENENISFTDSRDNKTYATALIGDQIWLAENVAYESDISYFYGNNEGLVEIYGRLYDWFEAQNICPIGWHLSSKQEWDNLFHNLKVNNVGQILKYPGWGSTWDSQLDLKRNEGSFAALPGGVFSYAKDDYNGYGYAGYFWTSNEYRNIGAVAYYFTHKDDIMHITRPNKNNRLSCRCVWGATDSISIEKLERTSKRQTTRIQPVNGRFLVTKLLRKNAKTNKWDEIVTPVRNLFVDIDAQKNINMSDDFNTFIEICAGEQYKNLYDQLSFVNAGLLSEIKEQGQYQYDGQLRLTANTGNEYYRSLPMSKRGVVTFNYNKNGHFKSIMIASSLNNTYTEIFLRKI